MKIVLFVIFLLLLAVNAYASYPYIRGIEVPIKNSSSKGSSSGCYVYQKYIVVTARSARDNGDIIAVRERASVDDFTCNKASESSEVFIIDGASETFVGIYRHFLFTDSGTGPDGRGIGIYDLAKKKHVYYAIYSGDEMKIEHDALIFYKDIEKNKSKKPCPKAEKFNSDGLDFGFEQEVRIDLESLREVAIGEITCSSRQ